jgi:two-component system, response regulator YesN
MRTDSRSAPPLRGASRNSSVRRATHWLRRTRQRILVVDDDATLEELLTIFLGEGYEISGATTGAEALGTVCRESIDLVVLDHRLPDRTGLEVLTELRSTCPGLPVVMLTGYGSEWICAAAFRLGVTDYLQKPVDAVDLVDVVHRILPPDPDARESALDTPALRGLRAPLCTPIQRAMGLIQERYWDKISLSSLARLVGMSKHHLSHRFRERSGSTFRDYLLRVRVERAKALLAAHEVSISEVAQMVGFSDLPRLDKVFKRHTGFSPSAYRSMSRGQAAGTGRQDSERAAALPP